MATASAPTTPRLTAEQFVQRPDPGHPEELVQGRIIPMPPPGPRYGQICIQAGYVLRRFLEDHDLGHVVGNDSGIITERGPDTVRGADIAFYSYAKLPKGPLPSTYPDVVPELVIEVRSPSQRWSDVHLKVGEYLRAGVLVVVVLDPEPRTACVCHADRPPQILGPDDELTLPEWIGHFSMVVRRFFD